MISIDNVLEPGGLIARRMPGYEHRPQQGLMADAVARALDDPHHLIVEAGTGVGKSFAYLVPIIQHITETNRRAVISTHTIALQEQLLNQDIPFLNAVMPQEFTAVLMKGRGNYLGLRRLEQTSKRRQTLWAGSKQLEELWRIEDWARHTTDGSLSDLHPTPDFSVWDKVKSEHGNCMGHRCRYYHLCFYQKSRRRAQNAQLLIVNHALFFADLALQKHGAGIIPDYDFAILDEAHTLEKVAGEHFGAMLSDRQVRFLLNSLYNKEAQRGFLATFHARSATKAVTSTMSAARELFDDLATWQEKHGRPNGRWTSPPPIENHLSEALRNLHLKLGQLRSRLDNEDDLFELSSYMERCSALADLLEDFLDRVPEDHVFWIEITPSADRKITLRTNPIHVAEELKETLFNTVSSAVLTSATLAINADREFNYIRQRIGLDKCRCLQLDSPFNFSEQVELHIEAHLPAPQNPEVFVPRASEMIEEYIRRTEGRALVLFTSYHLMADFAEQLSQKLAAMELTLLIQGQGMDRSKMLDQLRRHPHTVIFGTDSFWEGIDLRGDALCNLIITKLPFASPDQPLVEARIEDINAKGGNAFWDYQLPQAILRFKQGVGRLIRSKADRGLIVVLDSRIHHKSYGQHFLASLPPCKPIIHTKREA